ncbi:ubiquinone biosynthesis protein UbiA [Euzebyella marina]|uniref:Ubiquinone biosynthesis protein UbiA n=1 Tax=Euzebyella marina TaxID=1761453 RepID=A0A3G2L4F7_9FLAO|nr:UbiA-like protein EboC [Euzebyella marina]AYN67162.1 ubiquinone biosynthesis protein UbiA [Euzebyella marina]MAU70502.1 ubiquinone biosynthesis protein UbiA [Pseudozobellia sp.]MBG49007.1 ubiquinone biosynthesis protein UbiA [Pseudozobellia sp.]|tara:strand:- start:391 stop:1293 length:903 start_codon:yes stop_codon:yes gene_type:complete
MNKVVLGYARLARPANLPTAAADIFAGVAIGQAFIGEIGLTDFSTSFWIEFVCLVFASVFLYAGGVILNDVFDYKLDKVERPERPIPSGVVSLRNASLYGSLAMLIGLALAYSVSFLSGHIALVLALTIVLYDAVAKKNGFFGPLVMGLCRGLNLILGISILANFEFVWLAVIPVVYIFAITLISRGEVHGKNKGHIILAGVLYALVIMALLAVSFWYTQTFWVTLLYIAFFAFMVFRPLYKAYMDNSPKNIKGAVMAGVISLIILDASIGATFSYWWYGLVILALLPISKSLAKLFAVT